MSRFFIDRPKLAWVVAIFILLAGLLAIPALPVAQFPNVAPPQISISATYPGASATTVIRRASIGFGMMYSRPKLSSMPP